MSKTFFALILIVLDQLTKHLAPHKICNPYISWSIPLGGWFLILFIFLALILLFYIAKNSSYHYSILFIIAGAIGNIIDRFYSGCVTDFISFSAIPLMNRVHFLATFPTFNLADTFITIGTIWFLWQESKK